MKISFHGAAQMVTGSKHLLELQNGTKVLFDCGMFQGNPEEADLLNRHFGFDPASINYLLLSHAHIDHCGLIPKLVKEGFDGNIFCTPATFDLARILLLDSAHIQEQDVLYHNKKRRQKNQDPIHELYNKEDVENCLDRFVLVNYDEDYKLNNDLTLKFTDAGHILGSAAVHLTIDDNGKKTRITFSGDVGRYNDELLKSPEAFEQCDYLILESTYGSSLHEDLKIKDQKLLDAIRSTCIDKKGKLIIPSFSVGRTQELVYALNRLDVTKQLPEIDFYVDSPLSVQATSIMKQHQNMLNKRFQKYLKLDPEPFDFKRLTYISSAESSRALNDIDKPCVIISASGMADAGRVKHHIKHSIGNPKNTILFVGYCEPNSLGGKLMRNAKQVTIFGEPFEVKAEIQTIKSLSAHADYDDLCQFISCQNPELIKKLFIVHGEPEVQEIFKSKLLRKGFLEVEIPALHQAYQLY
jgi:metallo-beta-lactamase family protein